VGKTSTARILAKALNCPHVKDGVPCNSCEICDGISAGNDVDVLEIDGASNRGIDDIRSLRANVGVRSMRTKYKLYIIDEVHMLTREAFNALLKTLEEPPPNVKFVFCTTEPNKVPDTILSRCQRFDFSVIGDAPIAQRLGEIAVAEGFEVAEEALELVARRARGSMRDSQSLFDQLLAFSDGSVTADDVHRMLGTADDDLLVELFRNIVDKRPGEVLRIVDNALAGGVQAGELMDQIIAYSRDLMVIAAGGETVPLSAVASRHRATLAQQAATLGMHSVMAAFQILASAKSQMFRSTFARTILEMTLAQLSLLENLSAVSDLLSGRIPSLPAPAGESQSASLPDEKKNAELGTESVQSEHVVPAPSSPQIEFRQENAQQILQQLVARTGFAAAAGLRKAHALAISGPNRVDVQLDPTYDFARKTLEQAEHRSSIESTLSNLVGQAVAVTVQLVPDPARKTSDESPGDGQRPGQASSDSEAGSKVTAPAPAGSVDRPQNRTEQRRERPRKPAPDPEDAPATNLMTEVDPSKDAFVQQVIDVFDAKVVRITAGPTVKTTQGEAESSESDV
ncbi:MAG: DNA polymerase III subunit gamma/tau, partial [Planctomycetaceae bacterium]|nr:DNA polymerase III subunit gamma/tau [Planctomycetaceae bacterium]